MPQVVGGWREAAHIAGEGWRKGAADGEADFGLPGMRAEEPDRRRIGRRRRNAPPAARLWSTGKVAEIDPAALAAAVGDGMPLVVDFWAPWCGPCRMMAPEFAKAAQALAGRVRFAKIDTERFGQVSAQFGIRGIPLLIRFERGREAGRLTGARPAAEIAEFALGAGGCSA